MSGAIGIMWIIISVDRQNCFETGYGVCMNVFADLLTW